MASSFLRFLDQTQRRTTVGRTPLGEWSARRRGLYLTTHNTHNRQPCPRWDSNPTISASERLQTNALDRADTGTGGLEISQSIFFKTSSSSKNTFISKYHSTLNIACSWRSVVKNFHLSTYTPTYTRIYKSHFTRNKLKKKKLFRSIDFYAEAHIRTLIVSSIYNFIKKSSSSTNENGRKIRQKWKNRLPLLVFLYPSYCRQLGRPKQRRKGQEQHEVSEEQAVMDLKVNSRWWWWWWWWRRRWWWWWWKYPVLYYFHPDSRDHMVSDWTPE